MTAASIAALQAMATATATWQHTAAQVCSVEPAASRQQENQHFLSLRGNDVVLDKIPVEIRNVGAGGSLQC